MLRMPQLCVMLAWLGTTPLAPAQDNVPKDLRDWIHIISGGAPELLKLAPIHIEFERAGVGVPDAATIQFMRASVAGHPDHPDTSKLRTIESRLAHTDVSHVRLWVGNSMWRVATYYGNKPDQFFDLGATSDAVWNLLPDGISVSSRISPGQNDYSIVAMRLIDDGAYLFSGGMHLVSKSTHPWKFDAIELQGTHWTARASNPKGGEGSVTAEGIWDQGGLLRTVDRVSGRYRLGDSIKTYTFTATGWRRLDFPPYAVATTVNLPDLETGAADAVITISSIETVSIDDLRGLAQVPSGSRPDPVRGSLAGKMMIDNRSGTQSVLLEHGERQTFPLPDSSALNRRSSARLAGWIGGSAY